MLAGLGPSLAGAQSRSPDSEGVQVAIGYVANAPDLLVGMGGYVMLPQLGGLGLYVDVKIDADSPGNHRGFEPGLTASDVPVRVSGSALIRTESSYRSFNIAAIKPMNPSLSVYVGGGLSRRTSYWEFEAPFQPFGRGGVFWVESPSEEKDYVNVMAGILVGLGPRIVSHVGFETRPKGMTAGLSIRLPPFNKDGSDGIGAP